MSTWSHFIYGRAPRRAAFELIAATFDPKEDVIAPLLVLDIGAIESNGHCTQ
jgi:hypothetical protein